MSDNEAPTLMVIDGHSLAFRAFFALPTESFVTPDGQHTNAIHGFLSMLLSLLRQEQPTHLAVAFDISRYSFRTRKYPDYKATRGETPPEFIGQVPLLQEALEAMGVVTLQKEDYEADDILATLATQADEQGFRVLVVSGDRDTFQLVNDRITVLYPSSRGVSELKRYTPDAVLERYSLPPEKYPDIAALVGETSDNLIGIHKVGEKTAVKWITQYGSLESLLEHAEEIPGVVGQNLREQQDRARLNRELNALVRNVELPITVEDLVRRPIDAAKVREVFGKLSFRTLTQRVLALVGESGDETVSTPSPLLEPPTPKTLVDEELAHWLSSRNRCAVVVNSEAGLPISVGLSDGNEAVIVPLLPKGPDQEPLWTWLSSSSTDVLSVDAKSLLHALGGHVDPVPTVVADLRLEQWLLNPSGKSPGVDQLVEERYGLRPPAESANQLLQEDSSPWRATTAWLTPRLNDDLLAELSEGQRSVLTEIELPLVPLLYRMETIGIASDRAVLEELRDRLLGQAAEHQADAFAAIGREVNLGSPKQLQEVLFDQLGMPKTRQTKTGYSTDAGALQDLQESNPHPFLTHLLAHRDVTKLGQIVEGLIKAIGPDSRLHTTFDQTGTSTGRLSSLDPNLQNIPVRTDVGHQIRSSFIAGPEWDGLLTADYSQIEMRIMAHFAGDELLIEAFRQGEDLHRYVGSQVFDVAPEDVTAEMRTKVKAMSYGLAYGLSAFGLARQLRIPTAEAKALMSDYFARFGKVRDYLRQVVEEAKGRGYTETLRGRRRPFPDLASPNRIVREAAERQALNAPMQGTAADIIKRAMIAVDRRLTEEGLSSRMVLQVHDELVFEVAPGERERLAQVVVEEMSSAEELAVPLVVQVGHGANWNEAAH